MLIALRLADVAVGPKWEILHFSEHGLPIRLGRLGTQAGTGTRPYQGRGVCLRVGVSLGGMVDCVQNDKKGTKEKILRALGGCDSMLVVRRD